MPRIPDYTALPDQPPFRTGRTVAPGPDDLVGPAVRGLGASIVGTADKTSLLIGDIAKADAARRAAEQEKAPEKAAAPAPATAPAPARLAPKPVAPQPAAPAQPLTESRAWQLSPEGQRRTFALFDDANRYVTDQRALLDQDIPQIRGDGAGFADGVSQRFDTGARAHMASVPAYARPQVTTYLAAHGRQLAAAAKAAESEARDRHATARQERIVERLAAQVERIPHNPQQQSQLLLQAATTIRSNPDLSPETRAQLLARLADRAALARGKAIIGDPEALDQFFNPVGTEGVYQRMLGVENASGNPAAVSPKGALGLSQIMPETAREMAREMKLPGVAHLDDRQMAGYFASPAGEKANLALGHGYFRKMLRRFGGDVEAAVIAYNAGPGRAEAWRRQGRDDTALPRETLAYRNAVLGGPIGPGPGPDARLEIGQDVGSVPAAGAQDEPPQTPLGPAAGAAGPTALVVRPGEDVTSLPPGAGAMVRSALAAGVAPELRIRAGSEGRVLAGTSQSTPLDTLEVDVTGWKPEQKAALMAAAIAGGARGVGLPPGGRTIRFDTRPSPAFWGPNPAGPGKGAALAMAPDWARLPLKALFHRGEGPLGAPANLDDGGYSHAEAVLRRQNPDASPPVIREMATNTVLQQRRNLQAMAEKRAAIGRGIGTTLRALRDTGEETGGPTADAVAATLGPEAGQAYADDRVRARRFHAQTGDFAQLPAAEIERRVAQMRPVPGAPGFAAQQRDQAEAQAKAAQVLAQRRDDPVAAVADAPAVQAAAKAVDPAAPESLRPLVEARLAEQARLGIPPELQQPLSREEANALAAPLLEALPGQEAKATTDVVTNVRAATGDKADQAAVLVLTLANAELNRRSAAEAAREKADAEAAMPRILPVPDDDVVEMLIAHPESAAEFNEAYDPNYRKGDKSYYGFAESLLEAWNSGRSRLGHAQAAPPSQTPKDQPAAGNRYLDRLKQDPSRGEVGLLQRFTANAGDAWRDGTLLGQANEKEARWRADDPATPAATRAGLEDYLSRIALARVRYAYMPDATGLSEHLAAFTGQAIGGSASPESLVGGVGGRLAAQIGRRLLGRAIGQTVRQAVKEGEEAVVKGGSRPSAAEAAEKTAETATRNTAGAPAPDLKQLARDVALDQSLKAGLKALPPDKQPPADPAGAPPPDTSPQAGQDSKAGEAADGAGAPALTAGDHQVEIDRLTILQEEARRAGDQTRETQYAAEIATLEQARDRAEGGGARLPEAPRQSSGSGQSPDLEPPTPGAPTEAAKAAASALDHVLQARPPVDGAAPDIRSIVAEPGFPRAFVEQLPPKERAGLLTEDGAFTPEGEARLREGLQAHGENGRQASAPGPAPALPEGQSMSPTGGSLSGPAQPGTPPQAASDTNAQPPATVNYQGEIDRLSIERQTALHNKDNRRAHQLFQQIKKMLEDARQDPSSPLAPNFEDTKRYPQFSPGARLRPTDEVIRKFEQAGHSRKAAFSMAAYETIENLTPANRKLPISAFMNPGPMIPVSSGSAAPDDIELARRIGGVPNHGFANIPHNEDTSEPVEFDAISPLYVAQTKISFRTYKRLRKQIRRTFEAALATNRTPYFQCDIAFPDNILGDIRRYEIQYGIKAVLDTVPLSSTTP